MFETNISDSSPITDLLDLRSPKLPDSLLPEKNVNHRDYRLHRTPIGPKAFFVLENALVIPPDQKQKIMLVGDKEAHNLNALNNFNTCYPGFFDITDIVLPRKSRDFFF